MSFLQKCHINHLFYPEQNLRAKTQKPRPPRGETREHRCPIQRDLKALDTHPSGGCAVLQSTIVGEALLSKASPHSLRSRLLQVCPRAQRRSCKAQSKQTGASEMGIALGERPSHNDSCDVYGGACYGEMTQESAPLECYESEAHSECESHDSCMARLSSNDSENPLKLRDSAIKRAPGFKGQKMCCYTQCPSPLHSKKWRVVTKGTSAGARDWAPLVGQTLCDSCYSTFRKHGTFIRSVRTNEGWFRVDSSGSQPSDLSCGDKPKKSPQAVKRQRCNDRPDSESAHKRQDRRPVMVRDSLHENVRFLCRLQHVGVGIWRVRIVLYAAASFANQHPVNLCRAKRDHHYSLVQAGRASPARR